MPSQTFHNLPIEKKDKIINAAKKQFATNGYNKVSINKIITDAEIPKGSFYMYFRDKKDLLYYILSDYALDLRIIIDKALDKTNGDIFELFIDMYDATLDSCTGTQEIMAIFANVFMSMRTNGLYPSEDVNLQELISYENKIPLIDSIVEKVNMKKLNIKSKEEFEDLFTILSFITEKSILFSIKQISAQESGGYNKHDYYIISKNRFLNMISLLKNGTVVK